MASRRRYFVRSMRIAAGSFLAAAAVTTMGALGSASAVAAVPAFESVHTKVSAAGAALYVRRESELLERQLLRQRGDERERTDRVAGIRAEMDQAVDWGLVTPAQAERFAAQLESRIMNGR
ncbi:hypothetical protein D477_002506 [Arthrobacter crystallopoietes BAB-32]|uniref:Uncharacterized protein n=1 Tax=Arthrobacter crystallopoietes BAB-32 TaxID=1246476 RepID=N1VBW8_9MICC|nr:hypothetical protein [Arthrobacter crystallopoietes]EMY35773.1 hypothetical protein D477_002506 [Arthrobacter crystallopoietes BAB-32]